jgi:hypothetical protein
MASVRERMGADNVVNARGVSGSVAIGFLAHMVRFARKLLMDIVMFFATVLCLVFIALGSMY